MEKAHHLDVIDTRHREFQGTILGHTKRRLNAVVEHNSECKIEAVLLALARLGGRDLRARSGGHESRLDTSKINTLDLHSYISHIDLNRTNSILCL